MCLYMIWSKNWKILSCRSGWTWSCFIECHCSLGGEILYTEPFSCLQCTKPHPKPPWRITEIDIPENIQIFLLTNTPGQSSKEEWTNNHIEFTTEIEDDDWYLIIYSDSSLTDKSSRRRTRYGIVGYSQGHEVFRQGEALGEHAKVYDTKMAGLWAAVSHVTPVTVVWRILDPYWVTPWKLLMSLPRVMYIFSHAKGTYFP